MSDSGGEVRRINRFIEIVPEVHRAEWPRTKRRVMRHELEPIEHREDELEQFRFEQHRIDEDRKQVRSFGTRIVEERVDGDLVPCLLICFRPHSVLHVLNLLDHAVVQGAADPGICIEASSHARLTAEESREGDQDRLSLVQTANAVSSHECRHGSLLVKQPSTTDSSRYNIRREKKSRPEQGRRAAGGALGSGNGSGGRSELREDLVDLLLERRLREGLHDVAGGSALGGEDDVFLAGFGGDHEHREMLERGIGLDGP